MAEMPAAHAAPRSKVATVLRVEDGAITEIVTLTDRGLEEFWAGA